MNAVGGDINGGVKFCVAGAKNGSGSARNGSGSGGNGSEMRRASAPTAPAFGHPSSGRRGDRQAGGGH